MIIPYARNNPAPRNKIATPMASKAIRSMAFNFSAPQSSSVALS